MIGAISIDDTFRGLFKLLLTTNYLVNIISVAECLATLIIETTWIDQFSKNI